MANDRAIAQIMTFCEASNASPFERRCVMHTTFNRVRSGRFQKTVAAACLKRYAYSEFNDDAGDNANLERSAITPDNDPVMMDCGAAYDEVLAGAPDPTGNATHYYDKSLKVPPPWANPSLGAVMSLETPKFFFYRGVK